MSFHPWITPQLFKYLAELEANQEISLKNLGILNYINFLPPKISKFTVKELQAIIRCFVGKNIIKSIPISQTKDLLITQLIAELTRISPYRSAFEEPMTRETRELLSLDRTGPLLTHISHLRRIRLGIEPKYQVIKPIAILPFKNIKTTGDRTEYRANDKKIPLDFPIAPNEKVIMRLVGQRSKFVIQKNNITPITIEPPTDLPTDTVFPIDKFTGDHVDPKCSDLSGLRRHTGCRGNDPVVYTSQNYPSLEQDESTHRFLTESMCLMFETGDNQAAWITGENITLDLPKLSEKDYKSLHLNDHRKNCTPIFPFVDLTSHFQSEIDKKANTISIEVAWNKVKSPKWLGAVLIEKVAEMSLQEMRAKILSLPYCDPSPIDTSLLDSKKNRPTECSICRKTDNLSRCSGCRLEWYCNREHQTQDWKRHREECNKIRLLTKALDEEAQRRLVAQVDDDLFVDDKQNVSLMCSLGFTRLYTPIKGIRCKHLNCIELENFLKISTQTHTNICSICNREVGFHELVTSERMIDALKKYDDSVEELVAESNQAYKLPFVEETIVPPQKKIKIDQVSVHDSNKIVSLSTQTHNITPPEQNNTPNVTEEEDAIELD